jgi:uncharacterized protein HemX
VDAPPPEGEAAPAPAPPAPEEASAPGRGSGWLVGLLGVAFLVCAGGWLWQAQEGARLEAQLLATQERLARSEARVRTLEGYVGSVRERFATLQETLQAELEALGSLLAAEPGERTPEPAPEPVPPATDPGPGEVL